MKAIMPFVIGPLVLLYSITALAIGGVLFAAAGRLETYAGTALRASDRLRRSWLIPIVWGLAASVLLLFLGGALVQAPMPPLRLVGVLLLLVLVLLVAQGVAAGAVHAGRRFHDALGDYDRPPADCLRAGVGVLFLVTLCPFLGWLIALIVLAAGVGATIEATVRRDL